MLEDGALQIPHWTPATPDRQVYAPATTLSFARTSLVC
jgi:hypothetical protein